LTINTVTVGNHQYKRLSHIYIKKIYLYKKNLFI
jgi:hypothetical protein